MLFQVSGGNHEKPVASKNFDHSVEGLQFAIIADHASLKRLISNIDSLSLMYVEKIVNIGLLDIVVDSSSFAPEV